MSRPAETDIKPNILIVDDRRENLLATEKILKHLNAKLHSASSGNEALSFLLRHKCAVVLLDVQMPEMDGFEVAMLMQEHDEMRNIPVIFVTAISKEEKYATHAAQLGAVDYVFKPVNAEILKSKVKVYLDLYIQREQILELNRELRQSNEELERFAFICSHDMQEPLRMMNSYAGLLKERYSSLIDERGQRYFSFITSSARNMQKMVADVLNFSRVGREEIHYDLVDCNQLVAEVLEEFDEVLRRTDARIIVGGLPTIRTSPTLIRLLFQNLIGNALKFHDGSRTPEVRIEAETANRNGAPMWIFSIVDNGIGIDPKFADKVFAVFQRIHRKEEYSGTGIGLSTCKKFIELCGGEIWYESAPGEGTAFFFALPRNSESRP
jgi:two-component system, sensor histidine kinase and response regulator